MRLKINTYLLIALGIGIIIHGSIVFTTLEKTYDALIHLYFAEHYASNWFEPWNYKWYTGFTVMSYPPLVHQLLALLSFIGGFKFAMYALSYLIIILFITGIYRYSLLITQNDNYAGFACIFAVFSSTFIETLHLFGQLPTLMGISLLLHVLPEIYQWVNTGRYRYLFSSLILIAVTVCSHHVTPIFGMVFFIFPLIGLALMDKTKERIGNYTDIKLKHFITTFFSSFKRIVSFGIGSLVLIIFCILPYWINTKNNPITQVPIPHGSRDNFLEVLSSGLVFFLVPYGITLLFFPYFFYRFFSRRNLFFGLSFSMLVLLGTGGTTPIPRLLLGENAFNILTLDRFTFWASMMCLPLTGELFYRLFKTDYKAYLIKRFSKKYHAGFCIIVGCITAVFSVFTINFGNFRPTQPPKIKMLPLINFLNQDQHYKWRYLTLGFGDQMAWLGMQTNALTVDGNYHSARRLPELTSKAVERLENSKFRGIEGIGSLQQFLTVPEKFHLKYIFSNDKFYDPILYFCGWHRLSSLENGVMVWEKGNVKPLASILYKVDAPKYQRLIWGLVPVSTVSIALLFFGIRLFRRKKEAPPTIVEHHQFNNKLSFINRIWTGILLISTLYGSYLIYVENTTQISPENVVKAYYDAMDFKRFELAHSYLDKDAKKTLDQFMLEISVTDGLLSSYAKLENITTKIISKSENEATLDVQTKWITPLESVQNQEQINVVKKDGKWFVIPKKTKPHIPANQFFTSNITTYYNQGRRKISTQQTHHEDILPQPVLKVLSSKLVKKDSTYYILGELQNIDHFPADISMKGVLYDKKNNELATYSSKFQSKHKLNPMEITSFKIEFEETAWLKLDEKAAGTFDPEEFHEKKFITTPTSFVLHISSTVAIKDLYQQIQFDDLSIHENNIRGSLFNSGNNEVTIPLLIASYYKDNKLIWVDHQFEKESIRQHRKNDFSYDLYSCLSDIEIVLDDTSTTFVNGAKHEEVSVDRVDHYYPSHNYNEFISLDNNTKIKLELNNYIGNPIQN